MEESFNAAGWPRSSIISTRGHYNVPPEYFAKEYLKFAPWVNKCFNTRKDQNAPYSRKTLIQRGKQEQSAGNTGNKGFYNILKPFSFVRISRDNFIIPLKLSNDRPASMVKSQASASSTLSMGKLEHKASWLSACFRSDTSGLTAHRNKCEYLNFAAKINCFLIF